MPDYFPAFLDVRDRACLVVGGGAVGERKAVALLACGARVTIVSPVLTPGLSALVAAGRIAHRPRPFLRSDVRGARVVVAATGVAGVDDAVARAARRRGALVNVVDRPAICDFIVPSVLRRGELQIAVSTGGRSPALAREIRSRLEPLFAPTFGQLVERVGRRRARTRRRARPGPARLRAAERLAAQALVAWPGAPAAEVLRA